MGLRRHRDASGMPGQEVLLRTMTFLGRALVATALVAGSVRAEDPRAYQTLRYAESWRFLENGAVSDSDPFDVVKDGKLG